MVIHDQGTRLTVAGFGSGIRGGLGGIFGLALDARRSGGEALSIVLSGTLCARTGIAAGTFALEDGSAGAREDEISGAVSFGFELVGGPGAGFSLDAMGVK